MPPDLTSAEFPKKLHKKKTYMDPATIKGSGIAPGNKVKVTGTHGNKPTVWTGKIKQKNADGSFAVEDLGVLFEERNDKEDKRDTEDVSVTVTNADGESQPLKVKDAPVIP
jgi:hypothetical protein